MSKQSDQVLAGFIQLSQSDRRAVIDDINRLEQAAERDRKKLEESIANRAGIDLGPIDSGKCVCCGR